MRKYPGPSRETTDTTQKPRQIGSDGGRPSVPTEDTPPTSQDIATFLDAPHWGEDVRLSGVASLSNAGSRDLAFSRYDTATPIQQSEAGAVLCPPAIPTIDGATQIPVDNPRLAYAKISERYFRDSLPDQWTGIHPRSVIHDDAQIGEHTRIGANVWIGPTVEIGANCIIRPGTVIGGAGFGFERDEGGQPHRLAHRGSVRIESNVEIGPNCSIDRAVFDDTVIGRHTKLSSQVHIAHQVTIGEATLLTCGVECCGGATIGHRVTVHPSACIAEGVSVGDDAEIGMNSTVIDDVTPGVTVVGTPAKPLDRTEKEPT